MAYQEEKEGAAEVADQNTKLTHLAALISAYAPEEGANTTAIKNVGVFRVSQTVPKTPTMEIPAIIAVAQGRKRSYVGEQTYDCKRGNVLLGFYPVPGAMEIVEASPEKPFLLAGVQIDQQRMMDVLLRLERIDADLVKPEQMDLSSICSMPLDDGLLDAFIRLFEILRNPIDAAMLGDTMVDELYYRLLSSPRGKELRFLLQHRGDIQRIAKVVDYIYQNMDQSISVDKLAERVSMSRSAFYQNFRQVMHMSPFQYIKSVKLYEAQKLLRGGKKASEAGYLVGYNSLAQFSREYKRHFGVSPSATFMS